MDLLQRGLTRVVFCTHILILFHVVVSGQDLSVINIEGSKVYQPKVSFDGTKLVFMADYDGRAKPYISNFVEGSWSNPELIFPEETNGRYRVQYPQLNYDNTKLYFSASSLEKNDFDIYFSTLTDTGWSEPQPVSFPINSTLDELSPAVSANESKILFTRPVPENLKADEYCRQIFITEKSEAGEWHEPVALSPEYNAECEMAPYFAVDNKTFYYSSYQDVVGDDGKRRSKNNFNLYWAKIDGLFKFKPKPILPLVNEDEDESSFSIDSHGVAYFGLGDMLTSKQEKRYSTIQRNELSKEYLPEKATMLSGQIKDMEGGALSAEIQVINPYTFKILQSVQSDQSGYYQLFIPSGRQYSILAKRENYSVQLQFIELDSALNYTADFELFPQVKIRFNIYDDEYYFPLGATVGLYDSAFNVIRNFELGAERERESLTVQVGKQLYVLFNQENYHPDTLVLPFDKEVIFDNFELDIDMRRKREKVNLTFVDEETGESLGVEVTIYNVTRNERTKREVNDGKVTVELREGELYELSTSAQGYSYFTVQIDMSKEEPEGQTREINAVLKSIAQSSIVWGNITFQYNSSELNANSDGELDKLLEYLEQNENYKVEVSAHTDDKGAAAYNKKLSKLRANSVMQYLTDRAIQSHRLLARGFGESQPLFPNDSEENRAKNRRVEFKILSLSE